ncbi:hypothetical protein RRG08_021666 [Elysia crispata]|uniref:EF-hand domain-containing protein n=1 Tax=Elysia crispata TaxID=231223 RepID=A0AAE0XN04_9GAST|nr:hypothetical protein RRG08_021666 [Elysia crispata]
MNVLISTWLLVMTSSIVALGASVGGASKGSLLGLRLADDKVMGHLLKRHTRSFNPADITCVSIPRLEEMQHMFRNMVDHNADGKATPQEVRNFFQTFKNVTDDTVAAFIARKDTNKNGVLDFVPDYVQSLNQDNSLEEAREWFFLLDTDDDSFITREELLNVAQKLGMSAEDADMYYMSVDNNNDGKLSFDEYKKIHDI